MNNKSNLESRRKRPRPRSRSAPSSSSSLTFFLLTFTSLTATSAFVPVPAAFHYAIPSLQKVTEQPEQQQRPLSRLAFCNDASSTASSSSSSWSAAFVSSTSSLTATHTSSTAAHAATAFLPTWLTQPQSQSASSNLQTLAEAMRATNCFTDAEVQLVQQAIVQAAQGQSQIVAGAADFVHICVGLEMGVAALVAAAAHYGDCVRARLTGQWMSTSSTTMTEVAQDAAQIAADAARLKQLEMVASRVLDNDDVKAVTVKSATSSSTTTTTTTTTLLTTPLSSSQSSLPSRVRPDARDSENLRKLLMSETRDWRALAIRSAACLFRLRGLLSARAANERPTPDHHPKRL